MSLYGWGGLMKVGERVGLSGLAQKCRISKEGCGKNIGNDS